MRIAAGLVLIAVGILAGGGWLALAVAGLLPLAAGVFDLCVLGPLSHLPFLGPTRSLGDPEFAVLTGVALGAAEGAAVIVLDGLATRWLRHGPEREGFAGALHQRRVVPR